MRIYEVSDEINEGCRITMRPKPGVSMGVPAGGSQPVVIPLGNSLGRLLAHPDDADRKFTLLHGTLDIKRHGIYVVAQTAEESQADSKAMVWIDALHDQDIGHTRLGTSREVGHGSPTLITSVESSGLMRFLFVFKKNDGLFIRIPPDAANGRTTKRYVIWWDGQQLQQIVRPERSQQKQRMLPPELPPQLAVGA